MTARGTDLLGVVVTGVLGGFSVVTGFRIALTYGRLGYREDVTIVLLAMFALAVDLNVQAFRNCMAKLKRRQ